MIRGLVGIEDVVRQFICIRGLRGSRGLSVGCKVHWGVTDEVRAFRVFKVRLFKMLWTTVPRMAELIPIPSHKFGRGRE